MRFIFVRSSMQENIQRVLKRNSFTFSFLVLGLLYSIFLLVVFLYDQNGRSGMDRLNFPLYRACMDPWSEWSTPLISVMPGMQILLFLMNLVNIACNFYLYRFLEEKRKNNTALNETDMRKERTRNLLPAKVGVYGIIIFVAHFVLWQLAFALKNLDSSERAVMVAVSTDFYYCLYCPALTLYACPAVRRNFRLLQVSFRKARSTAVPMTGCSDSRKKLGLPSGNVPQALRPQKT